MIEGVLRHDTEMEVEKQYVDTHGQSEVGFAFCYLLGFALLPRLKNLKKQRLYRPNKEEPGTYGNLQPILGRPINWRSSNSNMTNSSSSPPRCDLGRQTPNQSCGDLRKTTGSIRPTKRCVN